MDDSPARDEILERIQADARRLEVLNEVARIATQGDDLAETLHAVTGTLAREFGWDFVACVSADRSAGRFVCEAVTSSFPTEVARGYTRPLGSGVVGEVLATGEPILLDDVAASATYVSTAPGIRSELCVPVVFRGEVIAALNLESVEPAAFHDQLPLLTTVARQVAGAIHLARANRDLLEANRRLAEANRRLSEAEGRIARLAASAPSALSDVGAWARSLTTELSRALDVDEVAVFALEQGALRPVASRSLRPPDLGPLRQSRGADPVALPSGDLAVAVRGLGGELFGAVVIAGSRHPLDETERRLLASFAQQLAGALEMRRMEARLAAAEAERAATRVRLGTGGEERLGVCPACGRCFPDTAGRCASCATPLDTSSPLPFVLLGRYAFVRALGAGGMATVFWAEDRKLRRDVAVKVVRPERFGSAETRRRFQREAEVVARIRHPHVVEIFDAGALPDGTEFLVLERLQGSDVAGLLARHGPATPRQVGRLVVEAAAALGAAHRAGVVHRDVKPENVFLEATPAGSRVKLLDFGLAKSFAHEPGLTEEGSIVGTPAYMSPEQVQGLPVDARSDLYSLAAVVYEALTGRRAVPGEAIPRILVNVLDAEPLPLSALLGGVPAALDRAFADALFKVAALRPPSVEVWADEVAALLDPLPPRVPGWPDAPADALTDRLRRGGGATRRLTGDAPP